MTTQIRNRRREANETLDGLIGGALVRMDAGQDMSPAKAKKPKKPEKPGRRKPPEDWTGADRKAFSQLSRDAQDWVLAREDAQREALAADTRKLAEERRRHQALVDAAAKLDETGVDPAQFLASMIEMGRQLASDPETAIGQLSDRFMPKGAPPAAVNNETGPEANPEPQNPNSIHELIDGLAGIIDEGGQPAFPHAERLRGSIVALIQAGLVSDLENAYRMAERLDDELMQKDLDARLEAARAADDAERQKAVQRARRVKPRHAVPAGASRPGDLDGLISQALNGAGF